MDRVKIKAYGEIKTILESKLKEINKKKEELDFEYECAVMSDKFKEIDNAYIPIGYHRRLEEIESDIENLNKELEKINNSIIYFNKSYRKDSRE